MNNDVKGEIMAIKKLISLMLVFLVVLSGCGAKIKNPLNYKVEDFTYQNQNGEDLGLKDLKGKVWVSNFIFTSCETVCPSMTSNMKRLQKMLKDQDVKAELISFSVDPEVDSPEILADYAANYEADLKNWNFLTGYSQDEIENFAKNSFKTIVDKPESTNQVIHATKFYIIDQEGKVMKEYSQVDSEVLQQIVDDAKILNKQ